MTGPLVCKIRRLREGWVGLGYTRTRVWEYDTLPHPYLTTTNLDSHQIANSNFHFICSSSCTDCLNNRNLMIYSLVIQKDKAYSKTIKIYISKKSKKEKQINLQEIALRKFSNIYLFHSFSYLNSSAILSFTVMFIYVCLSKTIKKSLHLFIY